MCWFVQCSACTTAHLHHPLTCPPWPPTHRQLPATTLTSLPCTPLQLLLLLQIPSVCLFHSLESTDLTVFTKDLSQMLFCQRSFPIEKEREEKREGFSLSKIALQTLSILYSVLFFFPALSSHGSRYIISYKSILSLPQLDCGVSES